MIKRLVLDALYESVKHHPEIVGMLDDKASAYMKLMPINRRQLERLLMKLIQTGQTAELKKLMRLLGNPPRTENVPYEYWQSGWKKLQADIEPVLFDTFIRQAEALVVSIGIGVDWNMINHTASNWARTYSFDLVRGLTETIRQGLAETLPRFYEEGWNLGQLEESLSKWYSPIRAEMIAITETTRASVEGERAVVEQLERESGIKMIPIWQTNNDERVCPICGPKHGLPIEDGVYPPVHPRCRCWVTYDFPKKA
jgi:hypothetical protein